MIAFGASDTIATTAATEVIFGPTLGGNAWVPFFLSPANPTPDAISPDLLTITPSSTSTTTGHSPDATLYSTPMPDITTSSTLSFAATSTPTASFHAGLSLPRPLKRSPDPADIPTETLTKKQRNNIAAHKYRQKKIDRIAELEGQVDSLAKERDELRLKLARQEAETATLREMLRMRPASS
jgi:hypothetical protein